jgi:RNA polymerase sigma factor (sigma-70 family)
MRDGPTPTARDFESFYDAARNPVYRAVVLVTRQPDRAEEATAEAFARALAHWERLADHPNPTAWVVRTALNSFVSGWRIWRRETYGVPETLSTRDESRSLDPFLLRHLWRLPRRQREVVAMRILLDLDARETAAALGIAEGTVGAHLKRALDHLREALAGSEFEEASR